MAFAAVAMTKPEVSPSDHAPEGNSNAEVLCGCANLTLGQFTAFIGDNRELSFEEVLQRTGSGDTCTACLLDLEYHFSEVKSGRPARGGALKAATTGEEESNPLKRQLYAVVDGLAPLLPVRKRTWSPVVLGSGITQWLWIANQALLYSSEPKAGTLTPMRVEVRLFDAGGRMLARQAHDLDAGDVLRTNLSEGFGNGADRGAGRTLSVGTVEVTIWATRPGMWGTTRPQFEILAPRSACAVHVQAPGPAGEHRFSAIHRPAQERLFPLITNPTSRPLRFTAGYRMAGADAPLERIGAPVSVPPQGAWIGEIEIPVAGGACGEGDLMDLRWRFSGPHKLHLLCASPALDRFSIDHL